MYVPKIINNTYANYSHSLEKTLHWLRHTPRGAIKLEMKTDKNGGIIVESSSANIKY